MMEVMEVMELNPSVPISENQWLREFCAPSAPPAVDPIPQSRNTNHEPRFPPFSENQWLKELGSSAVERIPHDHQATGCPFPSHLEMGTTSVQ